MNYNYRHLLGILAVLVAVQTHGAPGASITIARPKVPSTTQKPDATPVVTESLSIKISVSKDKLSKATIDRELTPTNDAVANRLGQQAITYSADMESVKVTDAYTLKKDGRRLPVSPTNILDQLPRGSLGTPIYGDMRQKVVIFPDVGAGDTLVLRYVEREKASVFPGQFMESGFFPRSIAWKHVRVTIDAPSDMRLEVETHGMAFRRRSSGSRSVYTWQYSNPHPLQEDVSAVGPYDFEPRFFASTFKSYKELGRAFEKLAAPKEIATPKIQQLANKIVGHTRNERIEAQKLYDWVSRHIRYVAIELGQGRVTPHTAGSVLAARYGDCKDHAVLYAALLRARGISSEMVLINSTNSYSLSTPPTLAQLNHVITWIPDLKIYADTTVGVAPFGTLPFGEYGKPAVYAVATGSALGTIPVLPPGEATVTLKTVSRLSADGGLSGETTTTATGPFAIELRLIGRFIQAVGPERAVTLLFRRGNLPGSGSLEAPPERDLGPRYSISGHFNIFPRPVLTSGAGFPMPPGIRLLGFTGGGLMGPLYRYVPSTEPTPCWSGTMVEQLSLKPPPGKHFVKLPNNMHIKTRNISFTAHWTKSGRTFTVRRVFTSRIDQPLCTGSVRTKMATVLRQIGTSYPVQIAVAQN